ncbi:MAG: DUF1801 domain-containing protein [Alphaproteobacteria bacterium]|nr:DUF1801 domain-containing protein [Alphaproteobacteria bacterium]
MTVKNQIATYIASQPGPKRGEMDALHRLVLRVMPKCRLSFLDGKDGEKTVTNPNIGYGVQTLTYAGGKTREFYQIGLSANTAGISVYIIGLADKKHLAAVYGKTIGKASISGYCIKFRTLDDINLDVLEAAIRHGVEATGQAV